MPSVFVNGVTIPLDDEEFPKIRIGISAYDKKPLGPISIFITPNEPLEIVGTEFEAPITINGNCIFKPNPATPSLKISNAIIVEPNISPEEFNKFYYGEPGYLKDMIVEGDGGVIGATKKLLKADFGPEEKKKEVIPNKRALRIE